MFQQKQMTESSMLLVSKYLDPKLIKQLDVDDRDEVLHELIDLLDSEGKLWNKEIFYRAILERRHRFHWNWNECSCSSC